MNYDVIIIVILLEVPFTDVLDFMMMALYKSIDQIDTLRCST